MSVTFDQMIKDSAIPVNTDPFRKNILENSQNFSMDLYSDPKICLHTNCYAYVLGCNLDYEGNCAIYTPGFLSSDSIYNYYPNPFVAKTYEDSIIVNCFLKDLNALGFRYYETTKFAVLEHGYKVAVCNCNVLPNVHFLREDNGEWTCKNGNETPKKTTIADLQECYDLITYFCIDIATS